MRGSSCIDDKLVSNNSHIPASLPLSLLLLLLLLSYYLYPPGVDKASLRRQSRSVEKSRILQLSQLSGGGWVSVVTEAPWETTRKQKKNTETVSVSVRVDQQKSWLDDDYIDIQRLRHFESDIIRERDIWDYVCIW